jgi:hypothetical protein
MSISKKMFNVSQAQLSILLLQHKELLPLLTDPSKKIENRLDDFCIAWLRKRELIKEERNVNE